MAAPLGYLLQPSSGCRLLISASDGLCRTRRSAVFRDLTTAVSIISVLPLLVARMAAELRQACGTMRLLEQVIEQAQDTILVLMADGRCAHVNDAFCRTTGWWREELVRLRLRDLIPGDGISTGDFQTLIRSGGSWQGTLTRTRKDGTRFRTTAALTALDDARGKTTHIISVERDISEDRGAASAGSENRAE